jgi:hypothetical protein
MAIAATLYRMTLIGCNWRVFPVQDYSHKVEPAWMTTPMMMMMLESDIFVSSWVRTTPFASIDIPLAISAYHHAFHHRHPLHRAEMM